MEHLFSPCTRLHDLIDDLIEDVAATQGVCYSHMEEMGDKFRFMEELDLDISTGELLSAERAFTYADLYAMLGNGGTMLWLTPHAAIARKTEIVENLWGDLDESCRFSFSADGKDIVAVARFFEHLLEICDVVLRLLAASVVHSVTLDNWSSRDDVFNAPTLAYLMEQCQSLQDLSLYDLALDASHCDVLGTYSRPDLEILLTP
jgi:hypothetical protein